MFLFSKMIGLRQCIVHPVFGLADTGGLVCWHVQGREMAILGKAYAQSQVVTK